MLCRKDRKVMEAANGWVPRPAGAFTQVPDGKQRSHFATSYGFLHSILSSTLGSPTCSCSRLMLSVSPVDLLFGDDDFKTPPLPSRLQKQKQTGIASWRVTKFGRGFQWNDEEGSVNRSDASQTAPNAEAEPASRATGQHSFINVSPIVRTFNITARTTSPILRKPPVINTHTHDRIVCLTPTQLHTPSPHTSFSRPQPCRSPSSPFPRKRSSRQRVSLIAGRVSIAPVGPPSPPPILLQSFRRTDGHASPPSLATSTTSTLSATPILDKTKETFLGERSISDFVIEDEIGRGAYGLVKRAREARKDGSVGAVLVIKQVIKSRILADCWKKHPKHGTIPIEIYVMSAISSVPYAVPPIRPWDPSRFRPNRSVNDQEKASRMEQVVKGHPNICPLLDFFEDNHYYYLLLPSMAPEQQLGQPSPALDLFDLVETFPNGLPPNSIRTYLGQIADALSFLHSHGIVHRDVKDENVVLGPNEKCILIDFGSSGLVRKQGWDTFSGTLDYAGPEILRGERYYGKEQDVWSFGVVAYVLLIGGCPFVTADDTQEGLESPFANASIALDDRCSDGKETEGEELDGGGALKDAADLVRACLQVDVGARPTFERILKCRFLGGTGGW